MTRADVLSPGCRTCAEGTWSCLFVNGICNARCFYCPTPQDEKGEPETGGVAFPDPDEYAEYVEVFGYRGVGLSGGEPLLTFPRTLALVRAIRRRLADRVHLWLYTNGRLATRDRLTTLADAGLDEIRFDLTAGVAREDALDLAVALLPRVTVEIPAVPGEDASLVVLAHRLDGLGVRHLNLHQLRATPHNQGRLEARGLKVLEGDPPLVEGSAEAALAVHRAVREAGLALGVNCCTWQSKSAAQLRGARSRAAPFVLRPGEHLRENGCIEGEAGLFEARIVAHLSYTCPFREVHLSTGRRIAVERRRLGMR